MLPQKKLQPPSAAGSVSQLAEAAGKLPLDKRKNTDWQFIPNPLQAKPIGVPVTAAQTCPDKENIAIQCLHYPGIHWNNCINI